MIKQLKFAIVNTKKMKKIIIYFALVLFMLSCSNNKGKIIIGDTPITDLAYSVYLENTSGDTKITFTVRKDIIKRTYKGYYTDSKLDKTETQVATQTYTLNPGERKIIGATKAYIRGDILRYEIENTFSVVGELIDK